MVTKWAGLLKSRAVYAAVVLTASVKKQADECIRGMLHRWGVRKRVDRTQRRRCFNWLFYWAADKQYLTSLRKWSVEATDNDEIALNSTRVDVMPPTVQQCLHQRLNLLWWLRKQSTGMNRLQQLPFLLCMLVKPWWMVQQCVLVVNTFI